MVPRRTARSTPSLATTPGNRVTIPSSSTAMACSLSTALLVVGPTSPQNDDGPGHISPGPSNGFRALRPGSALRDGGHLDVAIDDLLLEVLERIDRVLG